MNFPQGFHITVSETDISGWENLEQQFSEGNMNKKATVELIRRIFPRFTMSLLFKQSWFHSPRFDADCVMKNIFEIFDSQNTGRVILIYNTFISNMATSRWPVTRYFGYFQWPWTALVTLLSIVIVAKLNRNIFDKAICPKSLWHVLCLWSDFVTKPNNCHRKGHWQRISISLTDQYKS